MGNTLHSSYRFRAYGDILPVGGVRELTYLRGRAPPVCAFFYSYHIQ